MKNIFAFGSVVFKVFRLIFRRITGTLSGPSLFSLMTDALY